MRNFMAQQKQRKQLILTDSKNIPTYRFQPIQRLRHNFMTDSKRAFIHTKYNGDNPKVRIFSLIPQRQLMQPKFMADSMRNTQTQPEQPKQRRQRGFQ